MKCYKNINLEALMNLYKIYKIRSKDLKSTFIDKAAFSGSTRGLGAPFNLTQLVPHLHEPPLVPVQSKYTSSNFKYRGT